MVDLDSEEEKLNAEIIKAEDSERANYTDNNFWKTDEQFDVDALLDELDWFRICMCFLSDLDKILYNITISL